ncbi:MAG: carbohydrate binding domain-containing protein [Planctomycetes bacterium]|jgi:hypothetical protein|nr:carbohydrate binding domain-containing protein [Planctomycetota bacterium]
MSKRVVWLAVAVAIGCVASGPAQAQQVQNLLLNGGFETGVIAPYGTYGTCTTEVVTQCAGATVPEGPVEGKYCLHITVPAAGANNWDVGMTDGSHSFQQGKKYTFSCFMKCKSGTLQVRLKPERGADPWEAYNEAVVTVTNTWQEFSVTTPVIAATVTPASPTFHFAFAAGDFWMDGVRLYEGDYVKPAFKKSYAAADPIPADAATDIPRDVSLSWTAGPFAKTHNVYFGTSANDVNTATVPVGPGLTATTFTPAGPLEYGKTYYWRVDEVNGAPDNTVFKGGVWSFTVEPYAYPVTGVTATASSQEKASTGPANTINGSGLANDLHSASMDAMWASSLTDAGPVWIRYDLGRVLKLHALWVWNHNTEMEAVIGYGFKDVTIEYSTDGTAWTLLKEGQFAQGTGVSGYAHNTTVDLGGVMARHVRLTAKSNWSMVGWKQYGLAEVRFFYIPVEARAPQPANNAKDVSVGATLDWRPGREATSHKVTFGTDKAAVADGTAAGQTVTNHGFAPVSLDFGTKYYWKVDEIGATTYPGSVWNFTTQAFAAVDNFEAYTDNEGGRIYETWIDGWTNGTGSVVGYLNAPFAETLNVHAGKQAMPFEYNNTKTPFYSEAERSFNTPVDLTISGASTLALWYRGYPQGFTDKGNNAFSVTSTGTDIWNNGDQFRFVYKQLNGNGSITAKVDSLVRSDAWSKAGVMIRETLDAGSKHAMTVVTPDNGCSFQRRETTGGGSANTDAAGLKAPYWLRITRTSNMFKAERSPDGKAWTQIGADTSIIMSSVAYVGLAVTSHNANAYSTAEFSNVATTGTVTGAWQTASIGVTQRVNSPAPLYVRLEDKAGKKKTVTHPNAAATAAGAWTEWQIALSDLSGVNLAAVKKLAIGVGDAASPKAGGGGMLYIDDIQFGKPIVQDLTNLIANGGFETGAQAPWGAWGGGGATVTTAVVTACTGAAVAEDPIEGKYCLNIKVSGKSTNFWDCAFNIAPPTFTKGTKYTLSAFFKTKSGTGQINMKPEHSAPNWEGYGEQAVTITDQWVEYHVTTPVFPNDVSPTSLTFHIGYQAQEFWVDNVKFYEGDYVATK